jgi:hypothetical protein
MRMNKVTFSVLGIAILAVMGCSVNAQVASRGTMIKAMVESKASSSSKIPAGLINPHSDVIGVSDKNIMVGSWLETITFSGPDPMPPVKSLSTYTSDGSLLVSDQGAVAGGTAFSGGHGSWAHVRGRTFDWTSVEIIYSTEDGSLIGYLKVKGRYTVDDTGNAYTGAFFATVSDGDGNVLFTAEGTNVGGRIPVEPFQ